MSTGYSERPLAAKLGIKSGSRVLILNPPPGYSELLGSLPAGVVAATTLAGAFDFGQLFTASRASLEAEFPRLMGELAKDGMLWVCWPKGSSKVETDLKEGTVREIGLRNGLVDVKVCAVDKSWSGLKFVYRLRDRG